MKHQLQKIAFLILFLGNINCLYAQHYSWTKLKDMPDSIGRAGAVSFVASSFAYVGLGSDGASYLSDFYQYDFTNNKWTKKSNFPISRTGAGAISNGQSGIVGLGVVSQTDCYSYSSTNDLWSAVASFAGNGRYDVSCFTIGNIGYIGMGIDNIVNYNDFWSYNFLTDTWTQIANIGGVPRYGCFSFEISNKGYIGGGCSDNFTHFKDFYEYNPSNNSWVRKSDFGGGERSFGYGFSINGKGFAGLGRDGFNGALHNDFWSYNPISDSWTQIDSFPGGERMNGISFNFNNKGYVGTGVNTNSSTLYYDLWRLDEAVGINGEIINEEFLSLYPNPANCYLKLNYSNLNNSEIQIYNVEGKCVKLFSNSQSKILNIADLNSGVYFIKVKLSGGKILINRFVKE